MTASDRARDGGTEDRGEVAHFGRPRLETVFQMTKARVVDAARGGERAERQAAGGSCYAELLCKRFIATHRDAPCLTTNEAIGALRVALLVGDDPSVLNARRVEPCFVHADQDGFD